MKPIEPGCLAVIVNGFMGDPAKPKNLGRVVRVGRCLGDVDGLMWPPHWEVDQPVYWERSVRYIQSERCLLRIDGYEETEEQREEATA